MEQKIIVVAPHPDDETLGCGGTLLRYREEKIEMHWVIVTSMQEAHGFSAQKIGQRDAEIATVGKKYGFSSTQKLDFPTTRLDSVPLGKIIEKMAGVFHAISPTTIFLPYRGDAHTDHRVVFDAAAACTKWFRHGSVQRVMSYETLSESDFGLNPDVGGFRPNVFVDIGDYLSQKNEIMKIYAGEMGEFPFPRSEQAICALAHMRGVAAGYQAAEAFMLLRERV